MIVGKVVLAAAVVLAAGGTAIYYLGPWRNRGKMYIALDSEGKCVYGFRGSLSPEEDCRKLISGGVEWDRVEVQWNDAKSTTNAEYQKLKDLYGEHRRRIKEKYGELRGEQ